MKLAALTLALVASTAQAEAPKAACVDYAAALISGERIACGFFQICDADALLARLEKKGVVCEPMEQYIELAKFRLSNRPVREPRSPPPPIRLPDNRFKPPEQTTCRTMGNTVYCDTVGG